MNVVVLFSLSVMSDSCHSMDYSLPGSAVHEIFQARILERWVANTLTPKLLKAFIKALLKVKG